MSNAGRGGPRLPIPWILTTLLASLLIVAAGCSATTPAQAALRLEPVASMGENPFTPSVGQGQAAPPPAHTGGTVQADTVGLFGGTEKVGSCNPRKLVTFLQDHPDKAAAWAGVLGITPADIPTFVSSLTSVVLRSDTAVTNHGFLNGQATVVPSVLQAGTAVLVDRHGNPVTRCACGNPLTSPTVFTNISFVGPVWANFSATSVTVIQRTSVVINTFTLVAVNTGTPFHRPAGTQGLQDSPAPNVVAPGPQTATGGPPTTAAPPTTAPAPGPTTSAPGPTTSAPGPTTTAPGPSTTAPVAPLAPNTGAPRSSTGAPGLAPAPSTSTNTNSASWAIGTCYVDRRSNPPTFLGAVAVRNNDPAKTHSYQVTVTFGQSGTPVTATVPVSAVATGQTGTADVSAPGSSEPVDKTVACEITRLVDETGQTPAQTGAIAAPQIQPPPDVPSTTTEPPTTGPPTTEPSTTEPAPTTEAPTTQPPTTEPEPTTPDVLPS